jgi:hypothetical protein
MSLDFDAGIDLSVSIGALGDKIDALTAQLKRQDRERKIPVDVPLANSGIGVGGQNLYIGLGKPNQGFLWEVRFLVVGGATVVTAPSGVAYFLAGPPQVLNYADLSTWNLRDIANPGAGGGGTAFPQVAFYGTRQFVVRPGEHLACVITGANNGTTYVVGGIALQYPIETYAETYSV